MKKIKDLYIAKEKFSNINKIENIIYFNRYF